MNLDDLRKAVAPWLTPASAKTVYTAETWRPDLARPGADLRDMTLSGVQLDGVNLAGARLGESLLRGVSASGSSFTGAKLRGAQMEGCFLERCSLTNVDARAMRVKGSYLCGSMAGADLRGARLVGTIIDMDLDQTRTTGLAVERCPYWGMRARDAAKLGLDHFAGQDLRGRTFDAAFGLSFAGANLAGACFRGNVERCDFMAAKIDGCRFEGPARESRFLWARGADVRFREGADRCDMRMAELPAAIFGERAMPLRTLPEQGRVPTLEAPGRQFSTWGLMPLGSAPGGAVLQCDLRGAQCEGATFFALLASHLGDACLRDVVVHCAVRCNLAGANVRNAAFMESLQGTALSASQGRAACRFPEQAPKRREVEQPIPKLQIRQGKKRGRPL